MDEAEKIRRKYLALVEHLDERARRVWAATEADGLGYGGISLVARATGISRRAIHRGLAELNAEEVVSPDRVRRSGGGRKPAVHHQPALPDRLERLVEPLTRGDPESPLRWTCKSVRVLAGELDKQGIHVGRQTVATQLRALGYSLQGNRKTVEGKQHPDRNAQFEYINARVTKEIKASSPVISVDTKKKELVGNYKNSGARMASNG